MPEMLGFVGGTFRVEARVERACDTLRWGVRQLPDTVLLEDLRCSSPATRAVRQVVGLSWKEVWLQPASEGTATPEHDDAYAALERLVGRNVERNV